MKLFMTLMLFVFSFALSASDKMLHETPFGIVKESMAKGKPNFLEVGSDSCHSCQIMGRELYRLSQKYPTYNISFINVKRERDAAYALKIRMIPTQIIFDKNGQEVYRHVGVLPEKTVEKLFKTYHFGD